jgi:hypothetical protein
MADPKDPKDPKDMNKQVPPDPEARPEKDQIAEEDLEKISGGNGYFVPYVGGGTVPPRP